MASLALVHMLNATQLVWGVGLGDDNVPWVGQLVWGGWGWGMFSLHLYTC